MDDEVQEGEELRSSTVPKTKRRIATKTSLEENKNYENGGSDHPRVVRWDPSQCHEDGKPR